MSLAQKIGAYRSYQIFRDTLIPILEGTNLGQITTIKAISDHLSGAPFYYTGLRIAGKGNFSTLENLAKHNPGQIVAVARDKVELSERRLDELAGEIYIRPAQATIHELIELFMFSEEQELYEIRDSYAFELRNRIRCMDRKRAQSLIGRSDYLRFIHYGQAVLELGKA